MANPQLDHADRGAREIRLSSGTAYGLLSQIVNLGASFFVGVLVARLLGPDGKGTLSVVLQVTGILLVALNLGIANSNLYHIARHRVTAGIVVGNSILLASICGVIAAPFVILFLRGPLAVVAGVSAYTVVVAALGLPINLFAGWLLGIASGLGDLSLAVRYAVVSAAVTVSVLAGALVFGQINILWAVAAATAGSASGVLAVIIRLWSRIKPVRVNLTAARDATRYSVKSYLAGMVGYLHGRQDVLIIGWLAGSAAVGLYSVGVSFAELLWWVPSALAGAILVKAPHSTDESGVDYVCRSMRVSVLLMAVGTSLGILLVPQAIRVVFGREFLPSILIFYLLLPGILADGVMRIVLSFELSRERFYWRQSLATAGFNIALNVILIPRFGAPGAAIASSVSYTMFAVYLVGRFSSRTRVALREMLIPRRDDIAGLAQSLRTLLNSLRRRVLK